MLQRLFALSDRGTRDLHHGIAWNTIANIALMIPAGLSILVIGQLLIPLLDTGMPELPLTAIMLIAIAIVFILYFTNYREYRATYVAAYEESANRRILLAEKLRQLPLSFFGNRDLSDLTTTMMGDCTALEHTFSHAVPQLFGSILSILLVSISLFVFDWRMTLVLLIPLPVALGVVVGSKRLQDKFGVKKIRASLKASDGIQECLERIKDLKASGKERSYLEGLDEKLQDVVHASMVAESIAGMLIASASIILKFGFALVILFGASLYGKGGIDFMTYLIFLLISARIYDPLVTVMMQLAELFNAQLQIRRTKAIEEHPIQEGSSTFHPDGYDIVFDHVTFAYNDETVLDDVSFTARQGEVTALIGPSGGGKSTATKLAARFWDPQKGTVTIGGIDNATVDPETLLTAFSIVFQDVVLFNGTVMDNIRIGKKDASDEEVRRVAKLAQCEPFIERLPDGYETIIGENGATLSGGERQRLSIARALLKDAPIILLDEATASLDVENETLIQKALSNLIRNKTVLVIAHRLRTIANADHIVVLQEGRIEEDGTPRQLARKKGLYTRLRTLQKQSEDWKI